jgi:hypothetical protein
MNVVLLRVGVDTGSGGMHGPLFQDSSFEFIPIPDGFRVDERTYGKAIGTHGRPLVEYFPPGRRNAMSSHPMHVDPEFTTFTYGDPGRPKAVLQRLRTGDILAFYCGLTGWDFPAEPALYLFGYFEVERAVWATDMCDDGIRAGFGNNFHVRHPAVLALQRDHLLLVRGSPRSRLLRRAVRISEMGRTYSGKPLQVISRDMQQVFGGFGGKPGIPRSTPRWVEPEFAERAAAFIRGLE